MVFSSNTFLFLFLPAVLLLYFNPFFKSRNFKNVVLLLFSVGFYAWGEPLFVYLMLITALINWYIAIKIDKSVGKKKLWATLAIICDVTLLGVFKYLTFITENIAWFTGNNSIIIEIALPIGISFFSFQMMSYILDILKGNAKAQKNPLNVLLYITLFPQLIAGPIVRYETVEEEINNRRELPEEFTKGVIRFVYGLGKKVLISNYIAGIADVAFMNVGTSSVATAWLGAICYSLQIYFDFSGYSDMAIGLGLIFGFHFLENFNYPYIAKSVTDFWRRWHISLSTWFRDYVYIPLGGNRVSKGKRIRNLFLVWLLTGIWHGANWTFVVWGLFYFCLLLAEKMIGVKKIEKHTIVSRGYTLLVVLIAWVIFRAESLENAVQYLGVMFGIGAKEVIDDVFLRLLANCKVILPFAVIFSMPVYKKIKSNFSDQWGSILDSIAASVIFILSILSCIQSSYNPFIYFNF